ncbi:MAG: hypothetical protein ABSB59_28575 [Streptosporangiaceae bacterium]
MASNYPDEGMSANEGEGYPADLPFRTGGNGRPARTEARAELRDRETYYAELRFAVHCQSRSIPAARVALDNEDASTWSDRASTKGAQGNSAHEGRAADGDGTEGESWDEMIARFGDTWT